MAAVIFSVGAINPVIYMQKEKKNENEHYITFLLVIDFYTVTVLALVSLSLFIAMLLFCSFYSLTYLGPRVSRLMIAMLLCFVYFTCWNWSFYLGCLYNF